MTAATLMVPTVIGGSGLDALLRSLGSQTVEHQTIVVDNASADPGMSTIAERFPGVEVISLERNEGFSRAMNLGARRADGDALVLLNDDCIYEPEFVELICAGLDAAAGVVMAAGVLRDRRDTGVIDTAGMELDRTLLVFDYLNGEPLSRLDLPVRDPIGPCGAAAAFDREVFLAAGGFDERLFAYWEDVDLVLRLRMEGARCALAPRARGVHEHSATLRPGSARKDYLTGFGRGYVLRKWGVLTPRRLPAVFARDAVLCVGQAVFDRNLGGVRGRVDGFRVARRHSSYPEEAMSGSISASGTLRRRARRRLRLCRAPSGGARGERPRVLTIFHLPETSGPSRSLERELRWLSEVADLEIVVPATGSVAGSLSSIASVSVLPYETLTYVAGSRGLERVRRLAADVRLFRERIRATRPSVVLIISAMLPAALVAVRLERVPAIVYAGEILDTGRGRSVTRALAGHALASFTGLLARDVLACSVPVATQFRTRRARISLLLPAIDGTPGDRDGGAYRARHGIDPQAPLVVSAGAITEGRGQDVLIDALAIVRESVPRIKCLIAGAPHPRAPDRAYHDSLGAQVEALGIGEAVSLIGFEERPGDLLAAADVVVNPARFSEPFGRIPFEAALAGRPAVVTAVGAVPDLLQDGESAVIVPPDDPAAMAAGILSVLAEPELGVRLATGAARIAREELDPARSLGAFQRVVRPLLIGGSDA